METFKLLTTIMQDVIDKPGTGQWVASCFCSWQGGGPEIDLSGIESLDAKSFALVLEMLSLRRRAPGERNEQQLAACAAAMQHYICRGEFEVIDAFRLATAEYDENPDR